MNLYIHPAETHRLLKFLFHRMGRLVPDHNKLWLYQNSTERYMWKYCFFFEDDISKLVLK